MGVGGGTPTSVTAYFLLIKFTLRFAIPVPGCVVVRIVFAPSGSCLVLFLLSFAVFLDSTMSLDEPILDF